MMNAAMNAGLYVSLILSSRKDRVYRVSQVALREADVGRHDVDGGDNDGAPGTPSRSSVFVCECGCGKRIETASLEREPS